MIIIIVVTILITNISFLVDSNPLFHSRVSLRIHQTRRSLLRLLHLLPLLFFFTLITIFPYVGFDLADQYRHNNWSRH